MDGGPLEVIWSKKATRSFSDIIDYWYQRTGTMTYPRKIKDLVAVKELQLKHFPQSGKAWKDGGIRYVTVGNYWMFYQPTDSVIFILLFWDCRQDPDTLLL